MGHSLDKGLLEGSVQLPRVLQTSGRLQGVKPRAD